MPQESAMKRTPTLLVLVSLVASPALAYGQQGVSPEDVKTAATRSVDTVDTDELLISAETLAEAVVAAAREVVSADIAKLAPATAQQEAFGSGSRIAIGLAMIAGGAAIIWKGTDMYDSENPVFGEGRTVNYDSYLAYATGATFAVFGGVVLWGGLQGQGFQ